MKKLIGNVLVESSFYCDSMISRINAEIKRGVNAMKISYVKRNGRRKEAVFHEITPREKR